MSNSSCLVLSHFVAQAQRPAHYRDVDVSALSPYHRALLAIDGTVTRFLETQHMESISVVRLGDHLTQLQHTHSALNLEAGQNIVSRKVYLQGADSQRIYAYAASQIALERVEKHVGSWGDSPEGIGRRLLHGRVEQYRELLWCGECALKDLPSPFNHSGDPEERVLGRSYCIEIAKQTMMQITEWFALGQTLPDIIQVPSHAVSR